MRDIVSELVDEPGELSREKICDAHIRIMETYRFSSDEKYAPPGETRTSAQNTAALKRDMVL